MKDVTEITLRSSITVYGATEQVYIELIVFNYSIWDHLHVYMERIVLGLNIFYSDIKYTEKDWVRHEVRHYPLVL